MIWTAEHAIKIVRQLRAGASDDIRMFTRLGNAARLAELEQARGELLQAECCLLAAARRLNGVPPQPKESP